MAFNNNRYLPKHECQFLHNVREDLETYQHKSHRNSVLLFPPLPSRLRFLIHTSVEDQPEFSTFSVGENWCRRVVVCHSELRGEVEVEEEELESNNGLCEDSLRSREEIEVNAKSKSLIPSRSRAQKRPDKPLYMPRAARVRLSLQNSQAPSGGQELLIPAPSSCSCISRSSDSCSCSGTMENTKSSLASKQEYLPSVADPVADSSALCPEVLTQHEVEPQVWDQTVSSFANMTVEDYVKDKEDHASVPCSDVNEEIKAHLKEAVTVSIEHVQNDYSMYENVRINPDEFRHVIEIYNFPSVFSTEDLLDAFTEYRMKIKWIDNTHALGIFSSESEALHALSICHPLLKSLSSQ